MRIVWFQEVLDTLKTYSWLYFLLYCRFRHSEQFLITNHRTLDTSCLGIYSYQLNQSLFLCGHLNLHEYSYLNRKFLHSLSYYFHYLLLLVCHILLMWWMFTWGEDNSVLIAMNLVLLRSHCMNLTNICRFWIS